MYVRQNLHVYNNNLAISKMTLLFLSCKKLFRLLQTSGKFAIHPSMTHPLIRMQAPLASLQDGEISVSIMFCIYVTLSLRDVRNVYYNVLIILAPSGGSFIPPETLYQARVPIVDSEKCRDLYSSSHQVTESQICAGFVNEGGVDTCQVKWIKHL